MLGLVPGHRVLHWRRRDKRPGLAVLTAGVALAACSSGATDATPGFSSIELKDQPPATLVDRATLTPAPVVQLKQGTDTAAVSGITVTVSIAGGGSLSGTLTRSTDANGQATFSDLSIAGPAGPKQLRFTVRGTSPVSSDTVRLTAGPAAVMTAAAGDTQSALHGTAVGANPSVLVTDLDGNSVSGVGVTFRVTAGGGSASGGTQTTGSTGRATVGGWTLGSATGLNTLTASANGLSDVVFRATAINPQFTITLQYLHTPTAAQDAAFQAAKAKWESVVVGDLPDVPFNQNTGSGCGNVAVSQTIDDVLILVDLVPIDGSGGVLGAAGPCFIRSPGDGLTILGYMKFDTADLADLQTNGTLNRVILHEMAHVLGFGTLWEGTGLPWDLLNGTGGANPNFTGAAAIDAFLNVNGGTAYAGTPVPVEGTPAPVGTRDSHWRESVFDTELMTGFIGNEATSPLSLTTVKSLQDMGYVVNPGAAEAYTIPAFTPLRAVGPRVTVRVGNDRLPVTPRRMDRNGRIVP
jgi:hypothetical protein